MGEPGSGERVADCGGVLQDRLGADLADGWHARAGAGLTRIDGLRVPRDGDWTLYRLAARRSRKRGPRAAATAQLRLDTTAPSLAFANDQTAPAEVRVQTSDEHSGVAGGQIQIRRRGVVEWQTLETRREGTELVAAIPDDQLERGTYELQATATDAVGNTATTTRRADGREMVLDLPLRGDTTLSASLSRRSAGARRARRSIRIGYRKRAWLRGVLRSGGALLPDTRLEVADAQAEPRRTGTR